VAARTKTENRIVITRIPYKTGVCTAEGACVAVNAYEGFFCIDFDTTCGPQDDCECISGVCTFN
jgi:hypothetical protein